MAEPTVKCVASNCTHWVPGNRCGAANIDILNQIEQRDSMRPEETG